MSASTGRRLAVILVVLALSLWAGLANDAVLGLDLQGGVTMRYELLPPDSLPPDADVDEMIESTVTTLRQRIDAYGIRESSTSRQGEREIVIELPGKGKDEAETIKSVIARVGRLEWRIVASDDLRTQVNVADETTRLAELLAQNAGKPVDEIDTTTLDRRFPEVVFRWVPYADRILAARRGVERLDDEAGEAALAAQPLTPADFQLLRYETARDANFTGADIEAAYQSSDRNGNRAVGVSIRPDRASAFGDFSEAHKGQLLAIVLDGRLGQPPAEINDRLEGSFQISSNDIGGFSDREVLDYLTVIRSGSLQMKPRLMYENTIGPTLGESSIKSGTQAALVSLLLTIVFMVVYYRWHGVHATATIMVGLLILAALMLLLGATITLPGVAGLVLTLGMAVDANILVYERMREEQGRAKSAGQVVKLGFEKALSTIIDSNVTTLITAIILYKVGSGPVRGFAVVLMLGLLASVWSVLYFGRWIYDALLESERLKTVGSMARIVKEDTNIGFMKLGHTCLKLSAVAVVGGLVAFVATGRDKYGLDFLGGYKAHVRLLTPATQGEIKQAIDTVFPGAQVISIASGEGGRASEFVIKAKVGTGTASAADGAGAGVEQLYEPPMKAALANWLRPDFISDLVLQADAAAALTAVSGTLHFEGPVDPAAAGERLGLLGQLQTSAVGPTAVAVSGTLPGVDLDPQVVAQRIKSAFDDAAGLAPLSKPLIESTSISGRVGTELRDAAARALILSCLAIVIYIRVRFREYRYGFAAVLALLHDVLITLGIVSLAHEFGLVDVEIDLTMIAAFLTIIGYSLNDTIVLFDRIRENLPRMNRPLPEVINASMNQVLARTLLTSLTVLLTLAVIFVMNYGKQNVLEGFSFAMIVGVLTGTYSSIYVASPLLLVLSRKREGATS